MAEQRPSVQLDVEAEVKPSRLFPAPAENELLRPAKPGGSVQLDDGVLAMATPDCGDQGLQAPVEARSVGDVGPDLLDRSEERQATVAAALRIRRSAPGSATTSTSTASSPAGVAAVPTR